MEQGKLSKFFLHNVYTVYSCVSCCYTSLVHMKTYKHIKPTYGDILNLYPQIGCPAKQNTL